MPQDRSKGGQRGKNYLVTISPRMRSDLNLVRRRLEDSMDTLWMPALEMGICYRTVATLCSIMDSADEQENDGST